MVIALHGPAKSGKDEIASMLQYFRWYDLRGYRPDFKAFVQIKKDNFINLQTGYDALSSQSGWFIKKFATKLKRFIGDLTNTPEHEVETHKFKDGALPIEWNIDGELKTGRDLMIALGDGCREVAHDNIWINGLFVDYTRESEWLVPDMRYANEMDKINSYNGWTIKVYRPNVKVHRTDNLLVGQRFSSIIDNDGTLEDLFERVSIEYTKIADHNANI